jgi:transposase
MARSTREQWAERVARWRESGLPAAKFASDIGVSARSLTWWKWRLGSSRRAAALAPRKSSIRRESITTSGIGKSAPLTFVEMAATIETDQLEVVLASSIRIRVRPGFDPATLRRVLGVLEARR